MGTTLARFHSSGKTPDDKERLTMYVKELAITVALSFRRHAGILSKPVAFFAFKSFSCLKIKPSVGLKLKTFTVNFLVANTEIFWTYCFNQLGYGSHKILIKFLSNI